VTTTPVINGECPGGSTWPRGGRPAAGTQSRRADL